MPEVNLPAVLVAALGTFLVGGVWYSKILFGPAWGRASGVSAAEVEAKKGKHRHPAVVFGSAYLFSVVAAWALAVAAGPKPEFGHAVATGAGVGGLMVAASFGINYGFAGRKAALWFIDAGYHLVQFTLFGVVLGVWK